MAGQRQLDANQQFVADNAHSIILLADATLSRFEFCPIGLPMPQDIEEKIIAKDFGLSVLSALGAMATHARG